MQRILTMLLAVTALVVLSAAAFSAEERTPPGSYLVYRATTIGELRGQVSQNAVVKARYAQHFGVSPNQLTKYFADNLALVSLRSPMRVQSWYIDRRGKISVKTKLLPRGTMVFATRDGQPLLAWSCGNPLRASLPNATIAKTKPVASQTASASETTLKIKPPETKVLANPIETISADAITAPPAPTILAALPVTTLPAVAVVEAPAVAIPPVLSRGRSFPWLPLPLLALAIPHNHPNPKPLPEPSTATALVLGISMLPLGYGLRRSRARR